MIITNYDLGIPKKENRKGDHHSTEYFEADDDKNFIKIEEDDAEDNRVSSVKKEENLTLRLY